MIARHSSHIVAKSIGLSPMELDTFVQVSIKLTLLIGRRPISGMANCCSALPNMRVPFSPLASVGMGQKPESVCCACNLKKAKASVRLLQNASMIGHVTYGCTKSDRGDTRQVI